MTSSWTGALSLLAPIYALASWMSVCTLQTGSVCGMWLQHTSVRHGHQRLRRDMVYGAAAGQTRRQRRVCQGRDSLAGYVQQRDDDNVDDDPGLIFGLTSVTFVYT